MCLDVTDGSSVQHGLIMKIYLQLAVTLRIKKVKSDEWGALTITTEHGDKIQIPCHYIDF